MTLLEIFVCVWTMFCIVVGYGLGKAQTPNNKE